ncbi:MAG TPA: PHP domain-containing protein [Firmicutes bacterium]|jgi:predicted metal-dependent phosphoesterase TrpH|nr:PHP domain-containing protein [Bacillota bacterium]
MKNGRPDRYECDLHCHTNRSDGNNTPKELIDRAASLGMKAIAITDHDIVPPETVEVAGEEVNICAYAQRQGLVLLRGYEFSTDTDVNDVHILGYGLDWSAPAVHQEMERAKLSKSEAYRKLCVMLTGKGIPIDFDREILRFTDQNGVVHQRDPDEVQRKFIFEKIAEKGYAESWGGAKILVQSDPELNVRREKIHPFRAIELIHDCGGMAFLAHPYLIDEVVEVPGLGKMTRAEYIEGLIDHGLDGIEARYTYNKTSYKGQKTVDEIEREIKARYGQRLHISGGSDYHGSKKGTIDPREIGEAGISYEEFVQIFASLIQI